MSELVNFDALRETFPRLYRTVSKAIGLVEPIGGTFAVDFSKLSDYTKRELSTWLEAQREKQTPPTTPQPPEPLPEQIDMGALLKEEQAALQKAADEARARNRLEQFCDEQGLQRTPENVAKVGSWIQANLKGYWSQQGVDAAVLNIAKELTWLPKTAPAPPEPEPVEALEPLPNGEPRLPLDVDDWKLKQYSAEQLKDLVARRRAATTGKYIRPRGYFGSSI